MTSKMMFLALATIPLAGCASTGGSSGSANPSDKSTWACQDAGLQQWVGQKVTPQLGEQILKKSGASTLRWGPPRSAWTMDLRTDRVSVAYDDSNTITNINCG